MTDLRTLDFLNNTLVAWLASVFMALAILLLALTIRGFFKRRIARQANDQRVGIASLLTRLIAQTRAYFIITVAIFIGSLLLVLPPRIEEILRMALITVILIQIGFWGTYLINHWLEQRIQKELERDSTTATTLNGLGLIVRILFWAIILLLILENVTGVEVTTLIAGLGITGVAAALAVQNILSDLFASLSISLDRPFVIGDTIVVGEFTGKVEHVGLKSTRVRSLTGEQLIFSNSDLLNSRIRNYKRMDRRRNVFFLDITYDTPADKLGRIPHLIREIISLQPDVTFDRAHFKEFGASALRFEVVYFNENPDYMVFMDTQQAINLAIVRCFTSEGIEFAYPTQTLFIKDGMGGSSA